MDEKFPPPARLAHPINEAAQLLGIGRSSLYELAKESKIKMISIAGRRLVPRSEIERLTRVDGEAA